MVMDTDQLCQSGATTVDRDQPTLLCCHRDRAWPYPIGLVAALAGTVTEGERRETQNRVLCMILSVAFRFQVPSRAGRNRCRNLKSAALGCSEQVRQEE